MMASVLSARRRTIGRAALVSVAVLAVLLRLLNISHGGAGFTDNVSGWRGGDLDDEFDALHFAQLPLSEYVNFPDGGNQILFYLIARAWILLTPEPSNAVVWEFKEVYDGNIIFSAARWVNSIIPYHRYAEYFQESKKITTNSITVNGNPI